MKKLLEIILSILLFPFTLIYVLLLFGYSQSQELAEKIVYHKELNKK